MSFFRINSNSKVSTLFFIYSLGFTLFAVILMGLLYTFLEFREFKSNAALARNIFIESQKALVKSETEKVVEYINSRRLLLEEMIKKNLKDSNAENDLKEELKAEIRKIRFGSSGYIFVNTYDGHAVIIDSKKYQAGDDIWEMTDAHGLKVIQEEYKAAQRPGGDFISYHWKKLNSDEIAPKISFIKGIDDWKWMIGAGVYVDEIDAQLARDRKKLIDRVFTRILLSLTALLTIFLIVAIVSRWISRSIGHNFDVFIQKLSDAVKTGSKLNKDDYSLFELQVVSGNINNAIQNKIDAESLLRENEARFRTIFEHVPVLIAVLDNELNFQIGNYELTRSFSIRPNQRFDQSAFISLLTGSAVNRNLELLYEKFDGQFRTLELFIHDEPRTQNWAFFRTGTGENILVGYDITEIKDSHRKLKELNDTKDKYFSIISHDLQGPFNTIIGFSGILLEEYDEYPDEERKKFIRNINNSAVSMHKLLINLLTWARSQSGKIKVNPENFSMHEATQQVVDVLKSQAEKKSIQLFNRVDKAYFAFADLSMTSTIIQNLAANAVKFTGNRGTIEINAVVSGDKIRVSVKDNGIGIGKDALDKIFELDDSKKQYGTDNETGTGLGLVICKEFVEKMNGRIWAESEVGRGTTFYFTLNLP